jgi:C-terminal processing protease CtpA/Prc
MLQGRGAWRRPVFVLVDAGTASAAEDLVAWLKENDVAQVIGTRTAGAGCGYVDGGTTTRLAQVPVDVHMPNCARFLADGSNEVEGIAPDVVLPAGDDEAKAQALEAALR